MAGYGYVYELYFDGWLDVSPLVYSKKTEVSFNAFGTNLKGSRDVSRITLMHGNDPRKSLEFHSDVYRRLLEAKNNRSTVRFRMLHGTEAVFTGVVDLGNLRQSTGSIPREISLEIEDNSYLLDKEIPSSVEYPTSDLVNAMGDINTVPIFAKADPANSIVVALLILAGYSASDIDYAGSVDVKDGEYLSRIRFVYDVDDKKTFRDRIDNMLMEHRCVLTNNADGKFCIRPTFVTADHPAPNIPNYLISDKIHSSGGDYQNDGVAVKWSSLVFAKKQTVYQASVTPSFDSEDDDEGEEVAGNGYWPETGDIEEVWFEYDAKFLDRPYYTKQSRLQNKDLSLISSRNVQYEIDCDDTITEVLDSRVVLPKKAKLLFYNSAIITKRIRGFNVLADVLFRKKISTYTSPSTSASPEEYTSEFVFDAEAADHLASHMFLMHNYGDMTYTWTQKGEVDVLDVFTVQIPGTAVSTKAIVKSVTKTYPTPGLVLCKVTAIGIEVFNLLPSKKSAWINGSGNKGDKGESLIHQWAVGDDGEIPPTFVAIVGFDGSALGYTSPVGFMDQWYSTKPDVPADKYLWHRYRYPSDSEWIYIIETYPVSINAPYNRTIFKSAAERPATPSGDCSSIPTGWTDTPPERTAGETIWVSTGNVTWTSVNAPQYSLWSTPTAWSGDKGETGDPGAQGDPALGVRLVLSSETLPTTSRGIPKITTITCTALPQNLTVTEASDIAWSCTDTGVSLTPKDGDIYSVEIDTSQVSAQSIMITATISGISDAKSISKVADGYPSPMKLAMATTQTPDETPAGEPLVIGDYFVVGAEFTEESVTYKVGTLWEYTGTSWVLSSDKMKALNAMGDFASIASEAEDGVFCRLIAKEVYAQSAVIEEIGTKEITVKEDGSVASEDFAEDAQGIPTSGYKLDNPLTPLGRRGRVRAHGGIFNNTTIYGSIIHDALVTRKSSPTTPIAFPAKSAWNRKDFWTALSVTENSSDMIAASLNIAGTAYSYLRKITSATFEKQIAAYQEYTVTAADSSEYYTSPAKGQIRVNCFGLYGMYSYSTMEYVWVPYYYPDPRAPGVYEWKSVVKTEYYSTGVMIYVDGVHVASSSANTTTEFLLSVNKGSTIRIRRIFYAGPGFPGTYESLFTRYGIDWRGIQNSLQVSNETTSWDTIEGMTSDYLVRGRWQCSSPITFDSNTVLAYALANSFIAGFSDLPEGVEIETDSATSVATYGALTDQPINSVINYGSSVRLNYTGGYVTFVAGSDADGSFTGWYNAVASISVLSKEGIVVSNIIPKDDTREIGEFDNPFKKGFFEELNSSGPASVASINTGGLGAFLIGQNLRTTDSPTFAGLTVGGWEHKRTTHKYQPPVNGNVYIDAMDIGESRSCTFGPLDTTSGDDIEAVYLPSGGKYFVQGVYSNASGEKTVTFQLFAGGSRIAWDEGSGALDIYNGYFIIRRMQ